MTLSIEAIAAYQTQLLTTMEPVIDDINNQEITDKEGVVLYMGLICALLIDDSMSMIEKRRRYGLMLQTLGTWMHDDLNPESLHVESDNERD